MDHLYQVDVTTTGLGARVLFNGCTVFRHLSAEERGLRQNLAPWLIEGDNRVELSMRSVEAPEDLEKELSFWLRRVPKGDDSGGQWLVQFHWSDNECPLGVGERRVLTHEFHVAKAFGRWEWERARPYEEHRDRGDIVALVGRVHEALVDRDVPALNALLGIKLSELGRALDIPLEQMELEQAKYFEMHFADDRWTMEALEEDGLTLEPDAGGRLVHVLGPADAAPLTGLGSGRPFAFPLTVSNVDDSWLIVR